MLSAGRVGTQTPRVANYPPYRFSDADEVIDLYEAVCGRPLDEWQKFVLRHGLGRLTPEQWAAFKVACWVARQNGKGDIILALELAWLFLPGFQVRLVTHSAHLYSTAQEAFLRIKEILDGSDWLRPQIKAIREANGEQGIVLRTGQRLKFMARTRTGGRGFSAPRVVLDEAQELQALMMAAALPTMSAQHDPQVWFFGTPPDDPTAWCYNLKADGEAGADDLAWFDWGADIDLDDPLDRQRIRERDVWYSANPALGARITERFVESELKPSGLGENFPYERLGVWRPRVLTGAGVIDPDNWEAMADGRSKRGRDVAIAIDTTPDRGYSSVGLASRRRDGRMHLELIDHRRGTSWLVERLVQLKARHKPVGIGLDIKGPAGSLLGDLEKAGIKPPEDEEKPQRGDLWLPSINEVAGATGQMLDAAADETDRHIDQLQLNVAVAGAKTRPLGDAVAWGRRVADCDISPLVAVTLARAAFEARAHLVDQETGPEELVGSLMA